MKAVGILLQGLCEGGGKGAVGVAFHGEDRGAQVLDDVEDAHGRRVLDGDRGARHHQGMQRRVDRIVAAVRCEERLRTVRPARLHRRPQFGQDRCALVAVEVLRARGVGEGRAERRQQVAVGHRHGQVEDALLEMPDAAHPGRARRHRIAEHEGAGATASDDHLLAAQLAPRFRHRRGADPEPVGEGAHRRQARADRQCSRADQRAGVDRDPARRVGLKAIGEPFDAGNPVHPAHLLFSNIKWIDQPK